MRPLFSFRELAAPANMLSLSRIPLAVLMMVFYDSKWLVLSLLAIAVLSDAADGYLARRQGSTGFGPVIDVVCDKVMVGILLFFFLFSGRISFEGLALFLMRDVFILLLSLYLLLSRGRRVFSIAKSRWSGKVVTIAQFAALVAIIAVPAYAGFLVYAVAGLSLIAIFDYSFVVKKSL
jgi:CDP-diacylglycerol--glycerol-3-phosphate 3-phosphatidyltransferase